ncbi:AAA family ATPase [Nostocoides sp. F2B08]|uniref:ATP-binding protein n=1 Tax=Nostocoides sp. F2B08 TaxID=2653936 RepID=UPI0012637602|nr:ATP-binding protein [Tetrasphaera sp. F2B08]KAB7745673.1 AAA family ATPase [Tetrasphaera sp. F2B08]
MPRGPNPFRPGFGISPRVLAGRDDLLAEFETALDEGPGSPLRSVLVSGTRGMGKTVVLNELEELARVRGWLVIRLPESGGLVDDLVQTTLPTLLSEHDSARAVRRRVTGGGVSGLGSVTTSATERYPVRETAETLLTRLLDVLAQHGTGILLTLDEVQAVDRDELAAFASIYQHLIRDEREVAFAAAGLPVGVDRLLQHRGTTFLRRAERIHLPSLTRTEVIEAARRTIEDADGRITAEALEALADVVHGYPYLLQLAGHGAWRSAGERRRLTTDDVTSTVPLVSERMGRLIHGPALRDVPQKQRDYLAAMAHDDGPSATSDLAARLGVNMQHQNVYRTRLIERELITAAGHGFVDFALPYLREHLRRQTRG